MKWNSYNFLLKIGNICGFIPWINPDNSELVNKMLPRIYPAIITIVIFVNHVLNSPKFFRSVLDWANNLLNFCIIFAILESSYRKRMDWGQLIKHYDQVNKQVKDNFNASLDLGWKPVLIYLTYLTVMIVIRLHSYFENIRDLNFFVDLLLAIKIGVDCNSMMFLAILQKGFRTVNSNAKFIVENYGTIHILPSNLNATTPYHCKKLYENLYNMTICFSRLSEWLLATSLFHLLIVVLLFCQFLLNTLMDGGIEPKHTVMFTAIFLFRLVSRSNHFFIKK